MTRSHSKAWRLNRQINLAVIVQLVLLASLIVGSWVNLQSQLDLLQHDVTMLLHSQEAFQQKLDSLRTQSISYEYRLQSIEKRVTNAQEGF